MAYGSEAPLPTTADLYIAVVQNNSFAVERMVQSGMKLDATVSGATPISLAVYRGYSNLVDILVKGGADVNIKSKDHLHRIEPPLCSACRLGNREVVDILLKSPTVNVDQTDFFNKTPLWIATKERRCDLVELLLQNGASVNVADVWSDCPLYLATKYRGRHNIAEILIRNGCRVNNADDQGRSPLYWTAHGANRRQFEMLVHAGAKVKPSPWLARSELPKSWQTDVNFCNWIHQIQTTPLPLKLLVRNFIRRWLALRCNRLSDRVVQLLPLPEILRKFILCNDVEEYGLSISF